MLRVLVVLFLFTASLCAQTPDARQIAAQFGPSFKPDKAFAVLAADLDGDGKPDAVVVATAKHPLLDEAQFHYKVVDPYDAFFGFGDPKVTSQFSAEELHPRVLLVVHNWRAPQQKFVIINAPFEKLSLSRVLVKKKVFPAIQVQDLMDMKSDLYWDHKQWRWKEEGMD